MLLRNNAVIITLNYDQITILINLVRNVLATLCIENHSEGNKIIARLKVYLGVLVQFIFFQDRI